MMQKKHHKSMFIASLTISPFYKAVQKKGESVLTEQVKTLLIDNFRWMMPLVQTHARKENCRFWLKNQLVDSTVDWQKSPRQLSSQNLRKNWLLAALAGGARKVAVILDEMLVRPGAEIPSYRVGFTGQKPG